MPDTESVQNPINADPVKKESKAKKIFSIRRIIAIALLALLIFVLVLAYNGLKQSSRIYAKENHAECEKVETNSCVEFDARYLDGWAVWEVKKGWPLSFSVTTSGFNEEEALTMRCPIEYTTGKNQTLAKVKFFFQRDKIRQCVVVRR
jgi:hypothetical protein